MTSYDILRLIDRVAIVTLKQALEEANKNDRICPQPQKWNELYELLPKKVRKEVGWEPALPLILEAWWDTPTTQKTLRFREHLEWAFRNGALDAVYEFMKNLEEDEWFHIGD